MARKRKRGLLASLDLGRRGRRGGLGSVGFRGTGFERGRRRRGRGLAGYLRLDRKTQKRERKRSMAAKVARMAKDKLTPTERMQIREEIREAQQNDDVLSAAQRDAQRIDPNRPNVVQRVVNYVRNVLSIFRRDNP